eukprot:TRINITY_DN6211_c0_g1_i23.p1 TRINITY_DN6211_c0_g1~~TRINITY_DN6211_c0_g1_i23.p1  ORF type:complete len:355 (+),score=65.36 TRINITY_DN6211_c0_g1_i23:136-1065(+)
MKMLKHALSGVHEGQKEGGLSLEVMGLLIGKPEGSTIVVLDAVPLPVKGEANFVEAGPQIGILQAALSDSIETKRKENFIGWYHSHPFDVTTHTVSFLSGTDVQTQTAFQLSMPLWTSIVIDPLRSLAKQKPEMGCFRVYPVTYDSSQSIAPDGTQVVDKDLTAARWGITYYRYYALQTDYFMSSLGKKFVDIMSSNNLWIRALASSAVMEPENRERFPERVRKASEQLEQGSRRMGGYGGFSSARKRGGARPTLDQGTKAMCELAVEQCTGHATQITKDLLFNTAFTEEIGRAVQQECRDRSRMPSSA